MAPGDSTSSPRNHAADSNPELARKKQRLSEDPGASPTDSIIIEVDAPEDIGANMENAIEIEEDFTYNPWSEHFYVPTDQRSPLEQLRSLRATIQGNFYLARADFHALVQQLAHHIEMTTADEDEWRQHYLEDEAEFFIALIASASEILNVGDLFDPKEKQNQAFLRQDLDRFLGDLGTLCRRIISFLPDVIKNTLSRRDSAQNSARQHQIGSLFCIRLAAQVLSADGPALDQLANFDRRLNLDHLRRNARNRFSTQQAISSISAIIRLLSGAMREIKDSWSILQSTLDVFYMAVDSYSSTAPYPKEEVESVMEIINACIVPVIREKHPRALPDNFHHSLLYRGQRLLSHHVFYLDQESTAKAYLCLISSTSDAIIPEVADAGTVELALQRASDGNQDVLAELVSDSWAMQKAKEFLCSDILDIKSLGGSFLRERLVKIYEVYRLTVEGFEHPIVQHAVRFLRKNDIIPYILGPESRAGLLHHCADIVTFLAATQTYTDFETDIVWRACSTSVEADFVKAAFFVLSRVKEFADFERLLYVAKKYSTTPISSFGVTAVDFLPNLLKDLELQSSTLIEPADRLSLAFVCIDILKNANQGSPSPTKDRLRQVAMTEISRSGCQPFTPGDRAHIYKACVPDILNHTAHATSAVEVLDIVLQIAGHSEIGAVLEMLPISAAADELCDFVQAQKHSLDADISDTIVRLNYLGRLITLSPISADSSTEARLFAHLVGDEAVSNQARNAAWESLERLGLSPKSPRSLTTLVVTFVQDYVPSLSSNIATPRLIETMSLYLKLRETRDALKEDMISLLSLPLWETMVRFASSSPNDHVVQAAVNAVIDILFVYLPKLQSEQAAAVQCQSRFVRRLISDLRPLHDKCVREKSHENLRHYHLAMHILDAVFETSKRQPVISHADSRTNTLVIDDVQDVTQQMEFTAQVYGPEAEPYSIKVLANTSTCVSEFLAKLPNCTSATENRVVARGVEVTDAPNETLLDAGIRHGGVILIRPKYSFNLNLDDVLTPPGPVEDAILSEHDVLEAFLDGPDETASLMLRFLQKVRIPPQSRSRVVSPATTALDLFPPERGSRTYFSLFVLQTHITDFARLGVVDRDFVLRATRLLATFILDKERSFDPYLFFEVLDTLCLVLRERPSPDDNLQYFEDGRRIFARLAEILSDIKSLSIGAQTVPSRKSRYGQGKSPRNEPPRPLRNELGGLAYRALILACQVDQETWTAFTESDVVPDLHSQLLLDADASFCSAIAGPLESLFDDPDVAREVQDVYWRLAYHCLPEALSKSYSSESYFVVINKILNNIETTQYDEAWIRELVETLTSRLWSYQHTEAPPLLTTDKAMVGLLRLFTTAVRILKKNHKSSPTLDGLPSLLFQRFLFPPENHPQHRPLIQDETRGLVYDLMKRTFSAEIDYEDLVNLSIRASQVANREPGACFPGLPDWIRPSNNASGLSNLGMTCYMNSLLQQLFGNLQFRKFILDQEIEDPQRQETLFKMQQLFATMQSGIQPCTDTGSLAKTLDVQIGIQEDVHTFYTTLLSRLEDSMLHKESRQTLTNFFTGKSVTQIKGDCGHVSSREEPFTELSITVKNKASLHESLNEFVQGEPLEGSNKYMCMNCASEDGGRLVDAMRRTCLDEVPNSLTVCLKRFAFENMLDGENKVNDRFEFPSEIDMSLYNREFLENPQSPRDPDMFELVGVIVHQGSLSFGHYWSYVRKPAPPNFYQNPWMYLEDGRSFSCPGGIQEVQEQCFGGVAGNNMSERADSAYVLFYQRKSYVAEADSLNSVPRTLQLEHQILPAVPVPEQHLSNISRDNKWRLRIASLFNDQFSAFLKWLLDQYPSRSEALQNSIESLEEGDESKADLVEKSNDLDSATGELIVSAAVRLLLPDPLCESKLPKLMTSLNQIVRSTPRLSVDILRQFAQDEFGFNSIAHRDKSPTARMQLFNFIAKCLSLVRQGRPEIFEEISAQIIDVHSHVMRHISAPLDKYPVSWREYFGFATNFASIGLRETYMVLENGYLDWIFEILCVDSDPREKKRHPILANHLKHSSPDYTPLYEFLYRLLTGHADLSNDVARIAMPLARKVTAEGCQLVDSEIENLLMVNGKETKQTGLIIEAAVSHCWSNNMKWRDFVPGKLIALLISQTSNETVSDRMYEYMKIQYDLEEHQLQPLLHITLHIFLQLQNADRGIQRCKGLMEVLCKNLLLWQSRERKSLNFLREAHELVPEVVVLSVPFWASRWLMQESAQTRQAASDWLKEIIFGPTRMLDDHLEATRIAVIRKFVDQCTDILRHALAANRGRERYECMIASLEHAKDYMAALQDEVKQQEEQGVQVSSRVMVEINEARSTPDILEDFLQELNISWLPGRTFPIRQMEVRKSVERGEIDESDDDDATSDLEDDVSEEFGD